MRRTVRIICERWVVVALMAALPVMPPPASTSEMAASPPAWREAAGASRLALLSPDVTADGAFAPRCVYDQLGCRGGNISPALTWDHPPAGTLSFAVLMFDPDAPGGWWHWAVFDIPAAVSSLRSGAGDPARHLLPAGAIQVRNDYGSLGYGGPCPPPGRPHRYRLMLYALGVAKLGLDAGASAAQVAARVRTRALAETEIVAHYGR